MPPVPLVSVAATLEILEPPTTKRLYFWAMQVSFGSDRQLQGAAHIGLQWNHKHPGSTAANWGGYGPSTTSRMLLKGSPSDLPSARNDVNTRDFPWKPGRQYRLMVEPGGRAPDGLTAWRGSVIDLETGDPTVIRELFATGDELLAPMVWSEVFGRCEHSRVTARWSDLSAVGIDRESVRPRSVRVNYQARSDGGCDNTTVAVDELGILQATNSRRQIPQGATLPVPQ
jgi:hypothetical protein